MSRIFGYVRSPYSLEQVLKTGNSARDNHFTDVSNILFSDGGNYQNDTAIISNDITTLFFEQNTADTSINILETDVSNLETRVSFRDTTEFYVSNNGSDTTGNGSFLNPYATIQKAITQAELIASAANICVIHIASGHYTENITFTKGYVVLAGAMSSQTINEITEITGTITINIITGGSDLFNRQVGFQGLNITGSLADTSTINHTVFIQDCKIYSTDRAVYINSTCPQQRTYLTNVEISAQSSATNPAVEIANDWVEFERCDITVDANVNCIRISGDGYITRMFNSSLESGTTATTTAQAILLITSTSTTAHNIGSCSFVYTSASVKTGSTQASGICFNTTANAVMTLQQSFFSLSGTIHPSNHAVADINTGAPTLAFASNFCSAVGTTKIQPGITQVPFTALS